MPAWKSFPQFAHKKNYYTQLLLNIIKNFAFEKEPARFET